MSSDHSFLRGETIYDYRSAFSLVEWLMKEKKLASPVAIKVACQKYNLNQINLKNYIKWRKKHPFNKPIQESFL